VAAGLLTIVGVSERQDSSVERLVRKSLITEDALGRPFSERIRQSRRTLENYLKAGGIPRWMERVMEVDARIAREHERLATAYRALQGECDGDPAQFAQRWTEFAAGTRYDELNELIRQHNEWYPIERDLPMNPRTGDYVQVRGRSYRRPELGPAWVLAEFPPGSSASSAPARPRRDRP
jgi:hypothetical protein